MVSDKKAEYVREFLAEFVGTFLLVVIGESATATFTLRSRDPNRMDHFAITYAWGVGAMLAIMSVGGTSGAHINPAVTCANAFFGNLSWRKVPHYLLAQYLGSFCAAVVVYINNYDALHAFDGGMRITFNHQDATGHIFTTFPAAFISFIGVLIDQIICTAILMYAFLAITDKERQKIPSYVQPFYFGFVISVLCLAFGLNCSATLNPARDLAPRIFTLIAGYGLPPFYPLNGNYWWLAGLVGPHIGALVGGLVYRLALDHGNLRRNSFYHVNKVEMRDMDRQVRGSQKLDNGA